MFQTANLEHYTTYSEEELLPVADLMVEYMVTTPIPHESLFKKYAHKRYFRVCPTLFILSEKLIICDLVYIVQFVYDPMESSSLA